MSVEQLKFPVLNDSKWLYRKYVEEGWSAIKIARHVGAKSSNSVRQRLLRFNIPIRSYREAQIYGKERPKLKATKSFIDGHLLGDGFLRGYNMEGGLSAPYYAQKSCSEEYCQWVAQRTIEGSASHYISEEKSVLRGKEHLSYVFRTPSYDRLKSYYKRWYTEKGKRIPEDISITPGLLLQWFMDDGCCWQRRKESKTKQLIVTFASECFTRDDQELLKEKVRAKYPLNIKVKRYNQGTGYRLEISQGSVADFFRIIGKCPVNHFEYKWK